MEAQTNKRKWRRHFSKVEWHRLLKKLKPTKEVTRIGYPSADTITQRVNGTEAKVAVIDNEGIIVSVNRAWRTAAMAHGYNVPGYGVGVNYLKLCDQVNGLDADYANQASAALRSVLAGKCGTIAFEYVCASVDHEQWAMFVVSPLPTQWSSGATVSHVDISQIKDVEAAFRQSEARLRQHLDSLPLLVAYLDKTHRYLHNNRAYEAWFGIPSGELRGRTVRDVIGDAAYQEIRPCIGSCLAGETVDFEKSLCLKDGRKVHVRCTYVPDFHESGSVQGMFAFINDITKERSLAVRVEHLSMHDELTGLPNRSLFQSHLKTLFKADRNKDSLASLMIIDLDDFKDINDTLGHFVGDQLLRAVGRRLTEMLSPRELLARLGGDEFAIIQTEAGNVGDAQALARKIIDRIEAPFHIDDHELHVSASIGIAVLREDVADTSQLMKRADLALYRAKSEGRCRFQVFVGHMWTDLMRRQRMLHELRRALRRDELTIQYQPQIDLKTGMVASVESLSRWQHPKSGNIAPKIFVPIAESSGLIGTLGRWIIGEASARAADWRKAGHSFKVAINVSPAQIKLPEFIDQVRDAITETEVEPDWLEFEITETMLIDTDRRNQRVLDDIVNLGIHLVIDDFGTGYSSLAYLKRLPVDKIKIDQSFVRDIGKDVDDEAIVKAIITLGHQLGKRVVAEGVETASQASFLRENGCDEAQGFFFARALPEDRLVEWIDQRGPT